MDAPTHDCDHDYFQTHVVSVFWTLDYHRLRQGLPVASLNWSSNVNAQGWAEAERLVVG